MDPHITKGVAPDYYVRPSHVSLSSCPPEQFLNPGLGLQLYDFYVPLPGVTNPFLVSKKISPLPGSVSEPENKKLIEAATSSEVVAEPNEKQLLPPVQQGFGSKESETNIESAEKKIAPEVLQAMKHPKVKTKLLNYEPNKKSAKVTASKKIKTESKFKVV